MREAKKYARIGPCSAALRRGSLGIDLDGRTTTGRFIRDLEKQLTDHIGGRPNIAQQLLIQRIVKTTVQLGLLDAKMDDGSWTDLDARTHSSLVNRQRLLIRELGIKPAAAREKPMDAIEFGRLLAAGEIT